MHLSTVISRAGLLICVLAVTFPSNVYSSNILFFHSLVTASHRIAIFPLAEKLADQGHNVSYIFPMTKKAGSHPKIVEITPSKMIPILTEFVLEFDINLRLENRELEWLEDVMSVNLELCEAFYDSPEIQEWLANPDLHFDLILIDASLGECGYGLVHRFKAKLILFTPMIPPFLYDGLGVVPESSSVPNLFTHPSPTDPTLISRTISTLIPLLWRYKFMQYLSALEPLVWKKLNELNRKQGKNEIETPSLLEIESNTSLVLINAHLIEDYPIALPPMFVSFSGLWCSKEKKHESKPLPENLSKFLEGSDGFFYISFGSAVVASKMPVELRNQFFQAFRKFPNYRFFWRWTGDVPEDTPKNAILLPWFPQQDVLAHPKIKGFLTQTGRPSSQEAVCHGVPLIVVPIFADQDYNADRLEYVGVAINLNINTLTESDLSNSFDELLHNPKYANTMKKMSAVFRDRPIDPLDNVLFWVNFVLKYDNTDLLKPLGLKQTWYQRRLLDVYAFIAVIIFTVIGILIIAIISIVKCVKRLVMSRRKSKAD